MKKIPSVFKRDYEGTRQCFDEVVEGCEWVLDYEGVATEKFDGTSCLWAAGRLWKRYDRKLTKAGRKVPKDELQAEHFKPAPDGWMAAEVAPNLHTGHWPGWVPVGDGPEDQWHREGLKNTLPYFDGATYELVGPKVQGNPYGLEQHELWEHGKLREEMKVIAGDPIDRTFDGIRDYLERHPMEGLVFHHTDGRMAKVKSKDFGLIWPREAA